MEHKLLAQALAWLSSFPAVPETYITAGGLSGQIYAPPTMVAQLDGGRNMGEFWTALGIPPRPYFNLVVTITMDLNSIIARSAAVTTLTTGYQPGSEIASAEERVMIGGTVRDKHGNAVADVWVRIEPLNLTQVTDATGHFIFENVMRRGGLTLRARANGHPEVERSVEIPSVTGEYDLKFTA